MEPLSRQEQWNVTSGRSQTKPAAFGCSKQATLLAGAGGKHFSPFSTENSNPEPLLTPLEKRSWPVPKYPSRTSRTRGTRAEQNYTETLAGYSRMGSASLCQGQSPQLHTPGRGCLALRSKLAPLWRLRDVQGWRGHCREEKGQGTCEQLLLCLLSCSHHAAQPLPGKRRGLSLGQSFLMGQTPSRGWEHSVLETAPGEDSSHARQALPSSCSCSSNKQSSSVTLC